MNEVFGILAALIAIAGYIPYLRGIRLGVVQPHPYTWIISSLVSGIILAGQIADGAGAGAIPTATSEFFTLLIFIFSLKHGLRHITKIDTVFLVLAVGSIVPWLITNDPTLSVVFAVVIDVIAFVPTIRKTWASPSTESAGLYAANIIRHILTIFSLEAYTIATSSHSIVMTISNVGITLIIFMRRKNAVTATGTRVGGDIHGA